MTDVCICRQCGESFAGSDSNIAYCSSFCRKGLARPKPGPAPQFDETNGAARQPLTFHEVASWGTDEEGRFGVQAKEVPIHRVGIDPGEPPWPKPGWTDHVGQEPFHDGTADSGVLGVALGGASREIDETVPGAGGTTNDEE
jgi:hypothetical protein